VVRGMDLLNPTFRAQCPEPVWKQPTNGTLY
jgi:hypothetical protein